MRIAMVRRPLTALGLGILLVLPAIAKTPSTERKPRAGLNQAPLPSVESLLDKVRDFRPDIASGKTYGTYVGAHHKLLGLYWRQVARDRVEDLPLVTLMGRNGRFSGCGRSRSVNAYCPESNEIILSTRGMPRSQRFSNVSRHLLALTVLAHEWGHHVNHHSNRGSYSKREEDAADWRAGRYLAWLLDNEALGVKDFTDAANLFFSIGDFHMESPHNNPKARYEAFIAGVGSELKPGLRRGGWTMDTPETFSRVTNRKGNRRGEDENPAGPKTVRAEVYRFEIERGGQIAGNVFGALLGVVNCGIGSASSCAKSLNQQGKAKPDGWYRLRTMRINCTRKDFDIDGDGIRRQPFQGDRKGQAAVIAARACQRRSPGA